jgi:hypothetical protein
MEQHDQRSMESFDQTFDQLRKMGHILAPDSLWRGIQQKLSDRARTVSPPWLWGAAAAFLLLALLNVGIMASHGLKSATDRYELIFENAAILPQNHLY